MKSMRYRFQIFEKSDVNLKSLNGKFKDEKIKVLQKKPQYRIFEWKKWDKNSQKPEVGLCEILNP